VKLIGQTNISTTQEPDHLQFIVTQERGWIELLIPLTLLAFGLWALFLERYLFVAFCLAGAVFLVARFGKASVTQLDVSQSEMITRDNPEGSFSGEKIVKAPEVKSLGYKIGNKNIPSGLYAHQGLFKSTCLLPGLKKQQANEIADLICQKFPNIKR